MSQPDLVSQNPAVPTTPAAPVQKQGLNVYTMMLVISFLALLTACILLYMELLRWGPGPRWWDTSTIRSALRIEPSDYQLATVPVTDSLSQRS